MVGSREVEAGGAAVVAKLRTDQFQKDLRGLDSRVQKFSSKFAASFVGGRGATNPLQNSLAGLSRGLGSLGAAAGPVGIAIAAGVGAGALAARQMQAAFENGTAAIREAAAEAEKLGVSVEQASNGRIRSSDVAAIQEMDTALAELQSAWGGLTATLASTVAPAITVTTTALALGIDSLASYRDAISELSGPVLSAASALIPFFGTLQSIAEFTGIGTAIEDFKKLAAEHQRTVKLEAQRLTLLAKREAKEKQIAALLKGYSQGAKEAGQTPEQIAFDRVKAAGGDDVDAAKAAELVAEREAIELVKQRTAQDAAAAAQRQQSIATTLSSLQQEIDLYGQSEAAVEAYKLASLGATEEEQKRLQTLLEQKRALEENLSIQQRSMAFQQNMSAGLDSEAARILESIKTKEQRFLEAKSKIAELVDTGRLTEEQAGLAQTKASDEIFGVKEATSDAMKKTKVGISGGFNAANTLGLQAGGGADRLEDLNKKQLDVLGDIRKAVEKNNDGLTIGP